MATNKYPNSSHTIIKFKRKLASIMINDERVIELINNDEISSPEDLIYKNIFDFIRVPEAPEEQMNYICYRVYMPKVAVSSSFFQKLIIEIYVISHQGEMITEEGATRIDLLAEELERQLNGRDGFGKKPLALIANEEEAVGNNHRCRILRYEASEVDLCGN